MESTMPDRTDEPWLADHARDWVGAGLVSEHQADEILRFERTRAAAAPPRLTIVAEVASYLAAMVALAGGAAIIGPHWSRLGVAGQALIAVAIATVGLGVGRWLVAQGDDAMTRVGTFLWVVGAGGVALAAAVVVGEIEPVDEAWYPVVVGVSLLVVGIVLWRNLDRPLQLATAAVGLGVAVGGSIELMDVRVVIVAALLMATSLGSGAVAASGRVRPRLTALIVASVGLMAGSFMVMDESERLGSLVAVASATAIVVFALVDRSWPLVAVGVIAFGVAITVLMQTVLSGALARVIAVALGLIVVTAVAVSAQRSGRRR